jgi:membrane fusion protein, multidrug efflux system
MIHSLTILAASFYRSVGIAVPIQGQRFSVGLLCLTILATTANSIYAQPAGGPPGAPGGMPGMSGPLTVGVIEVETETVPYIVTVPGRAVAYQQVNIRPQVDGVVSEIVYQPGRPISIGDVLFRIDNKAYEAEVQSAEAEVARSEAELSGAQATLQRYETLEGTGITSEQVQSARVSVQQAQASISAAQAALRTAQLQLERTQISSPIEGVPDVAAVSVGTIVTANQTDALTSVTRLDPIYVDVEESSVRIQRLRERVDAGNLRQGEEFEVRLKLETGAEYEGNGRLVSPGTRVSTTTGTTELRIEFDNPNRVIMPGQFLRVDITLGTIEAILVPQQTTRRASDGSLSAFVVRNGQAQQVTLVEAGSYRNNWIVTGGIEPGEQVIVDNLRNVSAGVEVTTTAMTITDGVIKEAGGGDPAIGEAEATEPRETEE